MSGTFSGVLWLTLYSRKRSKLLWWERDKGRRRQTAILTHNFSSYAHHALLSSIPHLAFLLLLGWEVFNRRFAIGPLWDAAPALAGALRDWPNLFWPQADTDSRLRVHISCVGIGIYNFITPTPFRLTTWLFPFIYAGVSFAEKFRSIVDMQQHCI